MGTRSVIKIIKDKKIKVAQYCQWDGYPEGVGLDLLKGLRDIDEIKFKNQVDKCSFITEEENENDKA